MTIDTSFREALAEINQQFRIRLGDLEIGVLPIEDGPLHPTEYAQNTSLRIMWLMKEAYDEGEREGGWSLAEFFEFEYNEFYRKLVRGNHRSTWQPVVFVSYGIINGLKDWDTIPDFDQNPEITKVLGKIAWININKLPSETQSVSNSKSLYAAYEKSRDLLLKQIELCDPDVIICGNTYEYVKDDFGNPHMDDINSVAFAKVGKRLVISAYHPAQRMAGLSREIYVNDILRCVHQWKQSN